MHRAPMPEDPHTSDPSWQVLWRRYEPVTTPLRDLGLPTDIETSADGCLIVSTLPGGARLTLGTTHALPDDLADVTAWRVQTEPSPGDPDGPTTVLYDSTAGGPHADHGPDTAPMLAAVRGYAARPRACHCVIDHPVTHAQRRAVVDAIHYARSIGDLHGLRLHLARLTGDCPARR